MSLANCYKALGDEDMELQSLVRSFVYDLPRPEFSCRLGDFFSKLKDFKKAVKWFHLAIDMGEEDHAGFKQLAYSTWYPHLQCFCYWQLGNVEKSFEHHKKSREYSPNDVNVKKNEGFFKSYLKDKFE